MASSGNQYSAVVSSLSRRAVVNGGRTDAVSRQLGERLRAEYLRIMSEQIEKHGDEPDWFRAQLGGRDTVAAIDGALAAVAALPSPDASARGSADAAAATADARLEFTMQGRSFSFPAGSDTVVFIGREPRCDAVLTPETDRTTSRISAILYPQPTRGLLLVCDPGNLSGIRVVSRERTQLGLPRSVPFSRTILPLQWNERVDLEVCGVSVHLFSRDDPTSSRPAVAASDRPAAAAASVEADDAPRRRKVARRTERDVATAATSSAVAESPRVADEPPAAPDEAAGSDTTARRCVVCLDRPRGCCFLPCRHQVCCVACAQAIERSASRLCPICRTAVEVAMPMVRQSEQSYDAAIAPHAALRKRKDILDSPFRSAMAW